MRKLILVIYLILFVLGDACAFTYTIKELPGLPGGKGGRGAQAINEKGQVAGTMTDADGREHVVVWDSKGTIKDLSPLPGHLDSWAMDINDAGQVVGWSKDPASKHAVLWDTDGKPTDLGTLGGKFNEARAINNKGHVVGYSFTKTFKAHAFLWTPESGMVDLGALPGGTSAAEDIDDSGRIVGSSTDTDCKSHAVMWEADGTMTDLGSILGLQTSTASTINSKGQIAGKAGVRCGVGNAFLWDARNGLHDLGRLQNLPKTMALMNRPPVPGSDPTGMNDSGQVVGSSSDAHRQSHAFFWSQETGMIDLGALKDVEADARVKQGVELLFGDTAGSSWSLANDISNDGTIVGSSNGHAVVWTPSP